MYGLGGLRDQGEHSGGWAEYHAVPLVRVPSLRLSPLEGNQGAVVGHDRLPQTLEQRLQ